MLSRISSIWFYLLYKKENHIQFLIKISFRILLLLLLTLQILLFHFYTLYNNDRRKTRIGPLNHQAVCQCNQRPGQTDRQTSSQSKASLEKHSSIVRQRQLIFIHLSSHQLASFLPTRP